MSCLVLSVARTTRGVMKFSYMVHLMRWFLATSIISNKFFANCAGFNPKIFKVLLHLCSIPTESGKSRRASLLYRGHCLKIPQSGGVYFPQVVPRKITSLINR